jgi:hypothetical protein
MKNFKTYGNFLAEGKKLEEMGDKEIAALLLMDENYSNEQREDMAKKGFALSDGSFPIANLEDLKNAIMAYGRAKDQARAAKFIAKRAKALGAEDLIPDTDDFQKSLKEVATQVPAKTIAFDMDDEDEDLTNDHEMPKKVITEGKDIGEWNQGGLKGNKNVLVTTFVGPPAVEDFGLGRKCMQINVGMDYIALNPADIVELKDLLKSYKVK